MRAFAAAATLALLPRAALADQASALTWTAAARESLANNPDALAARRSLDSARALRKGALSPFLPQIAASASAANSGGSDPGGAQWSPAPLNSAQLSLSQNLFSGFADEARLEKARAAELTSEAVYRIARSKALADLATAFQGLA